MNCFIVIDIFLLVSDGVVDKAEELLEQVLDGMFFY